MACTSCLSESLVRELTALIQRRLAAHSRRLVEEPSLRRAAVLVPLYLRGGEPFVLLTKRTETVEHHKGQISFPGGAVDPLDPDPLAAALRETEEELGIPASQIQVLGILDDEKAAMSGFVITPFVGVIPYPFPLKVSHGEISEVVRVPLQGFRDPRNLRVEVMERGGIRANVYFYHLGEHEIWGITARIMKGMIDLVFAEKPA